MHTLTNDLRMPDITEPLDVGSLYLDKIADLTACVFCVHRARGHAGAGAHERVSVTMPDNPSGYAAILTQKYTIARFGCTITA